MRSYLTFTAALAIAAAAAAIPAAAPADNRTVTPDAATADGAMRAHVDPVTGELLPQPPPGSKPAPLPPDLIPDDRRLEFIEAPDGTHGVLFHGQRQATMTATLQADGSVKTECVESTAALPDKSPSNAGAQHE